MQTESAFDALAVSRAGAMGLMQLMPDVAVELGVTDPFDARQNVMAGAKYLRRLLDLYQRQRAAGARRLQRRHDQCRRSTAACRRFRRRRSYVKQVTGLVAFLEARRNQVAACR